MILGISLALYFLWPVLLLVLVNVIVGFKEAKSGSSRLKRFVMFDLFSSTIASALFIGMISQFSTFGGGLYRYDYQLLPIGTFSLFVAGLLFLYLGAFVERLIHQG